MNLKAKEYRKKIVKKHLFSELKSLPQLWSKTAKLNHLKRLVEYQTNTIIVDTKVNDALKEKTAELLKIDPFAHNFMLSETLKSTEPKPETKSVNLTKTLIESFRKKSKSIKSDAKLRTRSVKTIATAEDTWSQQVKSMAK